MKPVRNIDRYQIDKYNWPMQRSHNVTLRVLRRISLLVGLAALTGAIVLTLASTVRAQTPGDTSATAHPTQDANATPTEEPTPGPEVQTLVKITVDPAIQPIPKGHEFEAVVSVEQVEHLAGFDFTIGYDPKRVEPVFASSTNQAGTAQQQTPAGGTSQKAVKTGNLGQFLKSSGRQDIFCSDAKVKGSTALVTCSLLGAPLCAGGAPGVSGAGVLGSIFFKSKGGGVTELKLSESKLVLDDIAPPCDVSSDFQVIPIPHRGQGTTIELKKSSGASGALIAGLIAVVVAVVVVGGGGGYLLYRRRQS
jgi:hypothetical protein